MIIIATVYSEYYVIYNHCDNRESYNRTQQYHICVSENVGRPLNNCLICETKNINGKDLAIMCFYQRMVNI